MLNIVTANIQMWVRERGRHSAKHLQESSGGDLLKYYTQLIFTNYFYFYITLFKNKHCFTSNIYKN